MIYSTEPTDWRDLQDKSGSILRIDGCESQVERTVQTVRGKVDVNIRALDLQIAEQVPR